MQFIRGRKALVTGAASGIGRALALALAREGADLFLVDRDEARLHATAREAQVMGVRVLTRVCDLAHPVEISACVDAILSSWGTLNILINNAGVAYTGATHDMTAAQWDRLIAVNLLAPIQFVRELLPTLCAEDEAHILNVSSVFGLVPLREGAAYQTSQFALVGLSAALRAEYGPDIGVTALCPGLVDTRLLATFTTGGSERRHRILEWLRASPEQVAEVAIQAIRRNRSLVVVTWFMARFAPRLLELITRSRRGAPRQ